MARISSEDIERVRAASDIVAIASETLVLKPSGRKMKACCPFHDEKTPSFQIDPSLGLWHCFGCGEGGDIFDFVSRRENIDFPDAVRLLADRANIELTEESSGIAPPKGRKERVKEACKLACEFYHHELMRSPSANAATARNYLSSRGFNADICKRWMLGFAPGRGKLVAHLKAKGITKAEMLDANLAYEYQGGKLRDRFYERVMFPIYDRSGSVVAFGGRVVGTGEPKYLNSSETLVFHKSSNLFAIDKAKTSITNNARAVVVEGYTDAIVLHEAGIDYVVATLGTALTQQHIKILRSLRPKEIVYLFDGDNAGQKAADRATEFIGQGIGDEIGSNFIEFKVVILPNNNDPAEYCSLMGKEAMLKQIDGALPLIQFAIDRRIAEWDLSSPEQRSLALNAAASLLAPLKDRIIVEGYANHIADKLSVQGQICSLETVLLALRRIDTRLQKMIRDNGRDQPQSLPSSQSLNASDTEQMKMERELLILAVRCPQSREWLKGALASYHWSTDLPRKIASALFDQKEDNSARLIANLDMQLSGSASYLSSGTIEPPDETALKRTIYELVFTLKEQDLLDQIQLGNIQLRKRETSTAQEYDNMFKRVVDLQQELKELREDADRKRTKGLK